MNENHNPEEISPTPPARKRGMQRFLLLVAIPLVAALAGGFIYLKGGRYVETDNAYLKADKVPVSAEVSGTVKEVLVSENQAVKAGQSLFRLDTAPFEVAKAKADAQLAQARTDLTALKASYYAKQAEITQARTKYDFALREQQRQADLVAKHFISSTVFDQAKEATELAKQQIDVLQEDLKSIAESLGGNPDTPLERQPAYQSAQAELAQAKLNLSRTTVYAPLDGSVSQPPKPGQYVTAGGMALALVGSNDLWIEANFPETDLTYVHPGQPVTIRVDTYPGKTWNGEVDSLSPATGAEFSIIPAQNATGNWVKIAQRVPVRIKLASSDADNVQELRAGLSTEVEIDTGHRRHVLGVTL